MEEKLMELYEMVANEHDPQELRALILRLSVMLEAKERERREKDKLVNSTATAGAK
jgi:hypothetical protein